ncbi:MAG: holo-ACP synthase [Castellaniella sp.]
MKAIRPSMPVLPVAGGAAGIAGVGVDMVRVDRIEAVFSRHGERFLKRILGEGEQLIFHRRHARDAARGMRFLATRFAAKEAFSKAIGLGMHMPMAWSRMQTLNAPGGRPVVHLADPLHDWYNTRFGPAHVSLTDERDMVIAFVVIQALLQP